jgi:RNA polymerase subunit RPABC4/transcription elongation factor Spt4/archaellum component FlaF (FlaF/FlaG flagellin family)
MEMIDCPKCGRLQTADNKECVQCGIIFSKIKHSIPAPSLKTETEKPIIEEVKNIKPPFVCKKCNFEFSGAVCPNCGQSIPVFDRGCAISLVVILSFAFLLFGTLYVADKNTPGEKSFNFKTYELNAKVFIKPPNLVIENHDSFNWNDVEIEINGTYNSKYSFIPSNQHVVLPINSFSKSDGTRLNIYSVKIKNVFIYVKMDDGTGSYSGSWE